jgi:STE24 endopeptidase
VTSSHPLTLLFLFAVVASAVTRLWLDSRQRAHVSAHRAATPQAFRGSVSDADHQRAAAYTIAKLALARWEIALSAGLLLAWTLGGGIDLLGVAVGNLGLSDLLSGVLLLLAIALISDLLMLPLAAVSTFGVESEFGFNRQTPALFIRDRLTAWLLMIVLGGPLAAVLIALLDRAGELWWLWGWLAWSGFSLVLVWAYPRFIAPLFNRFEDLSDLELKARLEALLARCGFTAQGLQVMDGSRRSNHGNAYFTGFGRNRRIVLFDTLLESLGPTEVEAVLAHELGHFKLHHVKQRMALSLVTSLIGFAVLGWIAAQPWFHLSLGVSLPSSASTLALFALASSPFMFWTAPLSAAWSRRHEYQADRFASAHADAGDLISALVKLYRDNASTLTPDPIYSGFYDSHPTAIARIAALRSSHD